MNPTEKSPIAEKGESHRPPDVGYEPPLQDIRLAMDVANLDEVLALAPFSNVDRNSIDELLTEFGRFARNVVAPTDKNADAEGSQFTFETGAVTTPEAVRDAYRRYVAGGWGSVPFPSAYGGGELPYLVGFAIQEMMASSNLALSLNPVLTQSAIELLLQWATDAQRAMYLPKLIAGAWCGTMNLTESDSGSDLSGIQTQAVRGPKGQWLISGTKIFITWGEHDLAENIVHLVLARTPNSPLGVKGLSLFLVPKVIPKSDGTLGIQNSVACQRIERKLGIHASPTCTMQFDQAFGELVGPERGGMTAMFTMMNTARLSIGLQGPSVAECAYQQAHSYAKVRRQGRAAGIPSSQPAELFAHPDVRRMLLSMRTSVLAGRLLLYTVTGYRDLARKTGEVAVLAKAEAYVDLLTPVAKAWSSESGFLATSTGMQVLGGLGFIEDSGMPQRLRDSRIAMIYEGTNGIQAIDLVMRKLPREGGRWIRSLLDEMSSVVFHHPSLFHPLPRSYDALARATQELDRATEVILTWTDRSPDDALAGATPYLELLGLTVTGHLMIKRAQRAESMGEEVAKRTAMECEFYAIEYVERAKGLNATVLAGADHLASGYE